MVFVQFVDLYSSKLVFKDKSDKKIIFQGTKLNLDLCFKISLIILFWWFTLELYNQLFRTKQFFRQNLLHTWFYSLNYFCSQLGYNQ